MVSLGLRLQEKSYYRVKGHRDKTCGGEGRRGPGRIQLQGLQEQRRTKDRGVSRRFHIARYRPVAASLRPPGLMTRTCVNAGPEPTEPLALVLGLGLKDGVYLLSKPWVKVHL